MKTEKKKGLLLMVLAIAVLAVAYVLYQTNGDMQPEEHQTATSTPETATTTDIFNMEPIVPEAKVSTEGWKTCRNEEYGYEFKFPAEWKIYGEDARSEPDAMGKTYFVRESKECKGASVVLSPTTLLRTSQTDSIVYIDALPRKDMDDIHSIRTGLVEQSQTSFPAQSQFIVRSIVTNDTEGLLILYTNDDWSLVFLNHNARISMRFNAVQSFQETILSTFRLLDTPRTNDTPAPE